jgi:hypothetical protein
MADPRVGYGKVMAADTPPPAASEEAPVSVDVLAWVEMPCNSGLLPYIAVWSPVESRWLFESYEEGVLGTHLAEWEGATVRWWQELPKEPIH